MDYGVPDPLGNTVSWASTSTLGGLVADGTYGYDHRNRLSERTLLGGTTTEYFDYDSLGNLTHHGTGSASSPNQVFDHPTKPHAITERTGSEPVSYSHDPWGNLATRTKNGATEHFTFDSADRLVRVGSSAGASDILEVRYDSQGIRIWEKTGDGTERHFLGDECTLTEFPSGDREHRTEVFAFGERVAYYVSLQEAQAGTPLAVWGYRPPPGLILLLPSGLLLLLVLCLQERREVALAVAARPSPAALALVLATCLAIPFPVKAGGGGVTRSYRWLLSDKIGSGILVLDETGGLVRNTRFTPYGEIDAEAPVVAPDDRHVYAGHPQQEETELTYMKARWMDPESGVFLSVDPLILPGDPRSHSGYAYAHNNPISNNDPTGMCTPLGEGCGGSSGATSGLLGHPSSNPSIGGPGYSRTFAEYYGGAQERQAIEGLYSYIDGLNAGGSGNDPSDDVASQGNAPQTADGQTFDEAMQDAVLLGRAAHALRGEFQGMSPDEFREAFPRTQNMSDADVDGANFMFQAALRDIAVRNGVKATAGGFAKGVGLPAKIAFQFALTRTTVGRVFFTTQLIRTDQGFLKAAEIGCSLGSGCSGTVVTQRVGQ